MRLGNLNTHRKSVRANILQVHRNSKWKYPNKISNFIFHISNFTNGLNDISKSDRPLAQVALISSQLAMYSAGFWPQLAGLIKQFPME